MAQNAQNLAKSAGPAIAKIETRLMPAQMPSREMAVPQANAMLDPNGRVVSLAAVNLHARHPDAGCNSGRRLRPAEIRKIAEADRKSVV